MNRRQFLKTAAAVPVLQFGCAPLGQSRHTAAGVPFRRVRLGDAAWPKDASWERLRQMVGGRLIPIHNPLEPCLIAPASPACAEQLKKLKNPYYIGDEPGLTQTAGWVDAWTAAPSVYAVAAEKTADVAAAVQFARENHLRLVVKGGGHSYQGTSSSPDSLLIWTRPMKEIVLHDAFVPQGCPPRTQLQPAVSIGAGAIWGQAYQAVTTAGGRYVQGGGCTTVGVAGLIQSGGFGSFSKRYGMAAAALLEAEIVTADGVVRTANACREPDLFWAIKGGGGGSFGVVTRVTLRTRELPDYFGGVFGTIRAKSDAAFRKLTAELIRFYQEKLCNPHWGEQIAFTPQNLVRLGMVFQGLNRQEAEGVWRPFLDWIASFPGDFSLDTPPVILAVAARNFWNPQVLRQHVPGAIVLDDRPGVPEQNFFWSGDAGQAGQVLHGYKSAWLPASLLRRDQQGRLSDAIFASSRFWSVSLHFNKGLAGAPPEEISAARETATNPAVLDAFALAIIATGEQPAFPGVAGHEPDVTSARQHAGAISQAMGELLKVAPKAGAYVSESDFFQSSWQQDFWGANYSRLLRVKKKYDPAGLFFVHHGVGSEEWSSDGFTRIT